MSAPVLPYADSEIEDDAPLRIGTFILGKRIGSGTFAKVKAAIDQRNGRHFAIKILNRAKIRRMDVVAKLKREIQVQAMLKHPHIVRAYQTICTPTDIFIVMEHLTGGELFDYLAQKGKLNECEARRFFQQLISGVDYCHRHMVVHRDLKPENLLLDERCNLKITDFGLANTLMDGDFMKTSCGSPNYAAPEVIAGTLYAGPEVDIWSCGVILFALLCGFLPFDDDNMGRLFRKIKSGIFPIPKFLTKGALNLISLMLQVDPSKRIIMPDLIEHEWFKKDLPPYLFYHIHQPQTVVVDVEALEEACKKAKCSVEEMQEALMSGDPQNRLSITYDVVCTNRQMAEMKKLQKQLAVMDLKSAGVGVDIDTQSRGVFGDFSRTRCHARAPGASPFCRPNCDLCPKWGATQCLFGYNVPSLSKCDDCARKGEPGCIFSSAKLDLSKVRDTVSMENLGGGRTDDSECCSAAKKHKPHREYIQNPDPLSVTPALDAKSSAGGEIPAPSAKVLATAKAGPKRYKWHLGVRARARPADVMLEIFRAMKAANFVWQTVTPYHVIAKLKGVGQASEIMVALQLYEADPGTFVLDFKSLNVENGLDEDETPFESRRGSLSVASSRQDSCASGITMRPRSKSDVKDLKKKLGAISDGRLTMKCDQTGRTLNSSQTINFLSVCAALIESLSQ